MTQPANPRSSLVLLLSGLLVLVLATLAALRPQIGVALPAPPGDFTVGLLYGVGIGFLLVGLRRSIRHEAAGRDALGGR